VNEKPNLPRKHYRNLRAILYNWEHRGLEYTVSRYYSHLEPPYTMMKYKFLDSIRAKIEYFEYVRGKNDPLALQYPIPIYHFSPFTETDIQKGSVYVEIIQPFSVISSKRPACKE
jgi:hypothetical protein